MNVDIKFLSPSVNINRSFSLTAEIKSATQAIVENAQQIVLDTCIPNPQSATSGQYLMYNGSTWVAQTLPVYNGGVS